MHLNCESELNAHRCISVCRARILSAMRWQQLRPHMLRASVLMISQRACAHAVSLAGRMQELKVKGLSIINDAYNANPVSMRAALTTLSAGSRGPAHNCGSG